MPPRKLDGRAMLSHAKRLPLFLAAAMAAIPSAPAVAQDAATEELKALRAVIEQQGRQIDQLTVQMSRISAKLDALLDPARPVSSPPNVGSGVSGSSPGAEPAEFAVPAARVVTPQPPTNVHIVVKGESLDKIAKANGTTVQELQKLNRISDPKKLQIGQQLVLPPTASKKETQ